MANAAPVVVVVPGIVFLPNTGRGSNAHPRVVIAISGGMAFVVNWTDFLHYEESTCVLNVGDHREIQKMSVMYYPEFNEFPVHKLGLELASRKLLLRLDDLQPEVLARVIQGARDCPDLTDQIKQRYGL